MSRGSLSVSSTISRARRTAADRRGRLRRRYRRENARAAVNGGGTEPAGPVRGAEAALVYVSPDASGWTRRKRGRGWEYLDRRGRPLRDPAALKRIAKLRIPPAYREVWICPSPRGHLQAVGRDDRGRRQYVYHAAWMAARDRKKFNRMGAFGAALPKIRRAVAQGLAERHPTKRKVLCALLRLLEQSWIRVGNEEYARNNRTFGLTTLRDRHVKVRQASIIFEFRSKRFVPLDVTIDDPRLARIVRECRDLPGPHLFQYVDENGQSRSVSSRDVNAFLQEITGQDFTAKDFRTWSATVLAAKLLAGMGAASTVREAKANVGAVVKRVAQRLGNTPAVCRKSYIHPEIVAGYLAGALPHVRAGRPGRGRRLAGLSPEETAVLEFLDSRA